MLASIRRIGKNSSFYFIGQVLTGAIGFFLIPIYTRVLTPEDYGIIAIVTTTISIFAIFLELGLRGTISTFYFDYHKDPERLNAYVSTILLFLLPYSLVMVALIAWLGEPILQPLLEGIPFRPYVHLALGTAFFEMFFLISQTLTQTQEKASKFALLNILYFVINLALVIYFVVYLREGALGNTKARFITSIGFFILAIFLLRDFLVLRFEVPKIRMSLRFGLPLVPHALSGWILTAVDRLFLNRYSGLNGVGLFSLGAKLSDFMNIFTLSINNAWAPFFMSTAKEQGEGAKDTFTRLSTYYVAIVFFLGLALSITAREIIAILAAPAYHDAYQVVPIMTFGWVLGGMYYMVVNQIFFARQTKFLPLATFSAGAVQIGLNFLWIPTFGMIGAAWAMFVAQFCSFTFTWFLAQRYYPIDFEYLRIARIILVTLGLLLLGMSITLDSLWLSLLVKGALLVTYPLALFGAGFFRTDELAQARALVVSWLVVQHGSARS